MENETTQQTIDSNMTYWEKRFHEDVRNYKKQKEEQKIINCQNCWVKHESQMLPAEIIGIEFEGGLLSNLRWVVIARLPHGVKFTCETYGIPFVRSLFRFFCGKRFSRLETVTSEIDEEAYQKLVVRVGQLVFLQGSGIGFDHVDKPKDFTQTLGEAVKFHKNLTHLDPKNKPKIDDVVNDLHRKSTQPQTK